MASNSTQPCRLKRETVTGQNTCGFVGNPDLYGIGIRVGVYTQWLSALLSNHLLSKSREDVHSAYLLFSFALAIATVVITARSRTYCVFFAEVFVLVSLFFGGYFSVHLSPLRQPTCGQNTYPNPWRRGRLITLAFIYGAMISYNCWFWFKGRVADFYPTPCGSAIFLFKKFSGDSLHQAESFYAVFSIIMAVYYPLGVHLLFQNDTELSTRLHNIFDRFVASRSCRTFHRLLTTPSVSLIVINCFCLALAVLAIELTLVWNFVSDINSMNSVGQFIPFTVGVSGIVQVFWAVARSWVSLSASDELKDNFQFGRWYHCLIK
jgi:hypothetical protein